MPKIQLLWGVGNHVGRSKCPVENLTKDDIYLCLNLDSRGIPARSESHNPLKVNSAPYPPKADLTRAVIPSWHAVCRALPAYRNLQGCCHLSYSMCYHTLVKMIQSTQSKRVGQAISSAQIVMVPNSPAQIIIVFQRSDSCHTNWSMIETVQWLLF